MIFSLGMGISRLEIVFFQPLIISFYFFLLGVFCWQKQLSVLILLLDGDVHFYFCLLFIFSAFLTRVVDVVILYFNGLRTKLLEPEDRDSFIDLENYQIPIPASPSLSSKF